MSAEANVEEVSDVANNTPEDLRELPATLSVVTQKSRSFGADEPEADHDYLNVENTTLFRSSDASVRDILRNMNCLRKSGFLCDVTLKADTFTILAHKIVLVSCSSYFKAMFTIGMSEMDSSEVTIGNIDGKALEMLINFMYTEELLITEENVQRLLQASNLLQLEEVGEACCDFLRKELHPSNCLGIYQFADLYNCSKLRAKALRYVEEHFDDVLQHDEFLTLKANELKGLIASDRICAVEDHVFDAVLRWIKRDRPERLSYAPSIFGCVRFPLLSREVLAGLATDEEFLGENFGCKDYLIEALGYHLLNQEQRLSSISERARPRHSLGSNKKLLVVGGQAPKAVRSVEIFDFHSGVWSLMSELPIRRCRCGVVFHNGLVYAVGGFNGSLRVRILEAFNPKLNEWKVLQHMEARRSTLGVGVVKGLIFAIGGFDGGQGLSSAEVYQPDEDRWYPIEDMSTRRSSVGVCVDGECLYAIGGYDGGSRQCLSSVEKYVFTSVTPTGTLLGGHWEAVPEMIFKRSGAAVAVLNGFIFAIGGHDGPVVHNSVERYCHQSRRWERLSSMQLCRRNAGAVAYEGCIYVIGGDDGTTNLSSVERYDTERDVWTLLTSSMSIGRSYAGVCLIQTD